MAVGSEIRICSADDPTQVDGGDDVEGKTMLSGMTIQNECAQMGVIFGLP